MAKEVGRNLISSIVPELAEIVSGEKRTGKFVRNVLKNSVSKIIAKDTGTQRVAMADAGLVAASTDDAAGEHAKHCGRPAVWAPQLENIQQVSKLHHSMLLPYHQPSATKEVLLNKSPAMRGRFDTISEKKFIDCIIIGSTCRS